MMWLLLIIMMLLLLLVVDVVAIVGTAVCLFKTQPLYCFSFLFVCSFACLKLLLWSSLLLLLLLF